MWKTKSCINLSSSTSSFPKVNCIYSLFSWISDKSKMKTLQTADHLSMPWPVCNTYNCYLHQRAKDSKQWSKVCGNMSFSQHLTHFDRAFYCSMRIRDDTCKYLVSGHIVVICDMSCTPLFNEWTGESDLPSSSTSVWLANGYFYCCY